MRNIAQLFKALSEETRLRILALLFEGELCVCDLMEVLELPQSTISRHLAYLRNSGLIVDTRKGVWMYYRIHENNELGLFVVNSLKNLLVDNLQTKEDYKRLKNHLATKDTNACA